MATFPLLWKTQTVVKQDVYPSVWKIHTIKLFVKKVCQPPVKGVGFWLTVSGFELQLQHLQAVVPSIGIFHTSVSESIKVMSEQQFHRLRWRVQERMWLVQDLSDWEGPTPLCCPLFLNLQEASSSPRKSFCLLFCRGWLYFSKNIKSVDIEILISFFKMELIYNVVLISNLQQNDSVLHYMCVYIYIYIFFFRFFPVIAYCNTLSIVPCALCWPFSFTCFVYGGVYLLIPNSKLLLYLAHPLPWLSPLVTHKFVFHVCGDSHFLKMHTRAAYSYLTDEVIRT